MSQEKTPTIFGYEEAAIVRAMIQHENELLHNRIMWFITIEGLLFAALGFAWKDATWLIYIFCMLGLVTALSFVLELQLSNLGLLTLKEWWKDWVCLQGETAYIGPPVIGLDLSLPAMRNKTPAFMYMRPATALPWFFIIAWAALLIIHAQVITKPDRVEVQLMSAFRD